MSTRYYRLYQKGGPQRRVFLPNFWLKLVRPEQEQPPNVVQFACSMEMTKHDIKNYLEKIYNINVMKVNTRIALGKTRQDARSYIVKEDDVKLAYVTIPRDETFEFPNLFPEEEEEKRKDELDKMKSESRKSFDKFNEHNKHRPGLPGWFSL